jgi:hypothetical protein
MKNIYRLILNKIFFVVIGIVISAFNAFAQDGEANKRNSKSELLFPIKPGIPNSLSANMGELRPNHFHGGYDVKTDAKIGYPVYASEDGYVSRIKVSSYGYGNVVYITHPGNLQTVYAHLDKFNNPIGEFVLKNQYEQQSFAVELFPKPNQLPIKKGEIIGLAGNSGSSQGPHLHYEIRDTMDKVLNPSDFGFNEIKDNIPPIFQKLAIVPLDIQSRVNGEFSRLEVPIVKGKGQPTYSIASSINAFGSIGFQLKATDKKNNTHNSFGINYIQVLVDDKVAFSHNLMSFTFDETRYINSHMDFPLYATTGKRFERLYVSDGDKLSTYSYSNTSILNKGKLFIQDGTKHKITIIIKDDFLNESTLNFTVTGSNKGIHVVPSSSLPNQLLSSDIIENTLKLSTKALGDVGCTVFLKGNKQTIPAAYSQKGFVVYLYDLRKGLPDSVKVGSLLADMNFAKIVPSGSDQKVSYENINVTFPNGALADTLYLQMRKDIWNGIPAYSIHSNIIPLYDSITLAIAPQQSFTDKSKVGIYSISRNRPSYEGGAWKDNKMEVKTRNLGKFVLLEDTIKPTINFLNNFGNSISFRINDNLSGISSFKACLNGYWLLMNYDHKRSLIWSERLDKTVPLKGEFILEVRDNVGNVSKYTTNLE